eukprot:COSAG01_NODE_18031_length_1104_cov_7.126368_1_plen_195_part_00
MVSDIEGLVQKARGYIVGDCIGDDVDVVEKILAIKSFVQQKIVDNGGLPSFDGADHYEERPSPWHIDANLWKVRVMGLGGDVPWLYDGSNLGRIHTLYYIYNLHINYESSLSILNLEAPRPRIILGLEPTLNGRSNSLLQVILALLLLAFSFQALFLLGFALLACTLEACQRARLRKTGCVICFVKWMQTSVAL